MSINMEDVLKALETDQTPEQAFASGLRDEQVKTASANKDEELMEKVAEADEEGRIMARGFWDEFQKIAISMQAEYPADPGAIPNNPAVEVPRGELAQPQEEKGMKARALINQMTGATRVGMGEVSTPAGPMPEEKVDPVFDGVQPIAYDQAKQQEKSVFGQEKEAGMNILANLYNKFIGGQE